MSRGHQNIYVWAILFLLLGTLRTVPAFSAETFVQELPVSIGASEADVFDKLGHPAVADFEWIYNDERGDRHYYIEFTDHKVSQVKVPNSFGKKDRSEKLVNGLTHEDNSKKWTKVLGKPQRVIPRGYETVLYWKKSQVWVSLSITAETNRNDWFCIQREEKKEDGLTLEDRMEIRLRRIEDIVTPKEKARKEKSRQSLGVAK